MAVCKCKGTVSNIAVRENKAGMWRIGFQLKECPPDKWFNQKDGTYEKEEPNFKRGDEVEVIYAKSKWGVQWTEVEVTKEGPGDQGNWKGKGTPAYDPRPGAIVSSFIAAGGISSSIEEMWENAEKIYIMAQRAIEDTSFGNYGKDEEEDVMKQMGLNNEEEEEVNEEEILNEEMPF